MPWTTPADWTVNEVVTAAAFNAQLRDNLNWLHDPSKYFCRAYVSGAPAPLPNASEALAQLNTVDSGDDPSAMFNATTHLITVPAKGLYEVQASMRLGTGSTFLCALGLYLNASSGPPTIPGPSVQANGGTMARILRLNPGDTIGLNVWQSSGAALGYDTGYGGRGNQLQVVCLSLQS